MSNCALVSLTAPVSLTADGFSRSPTASKTSSVQFCYRVGMNYVSCSPYRVPIARLAAAQAAISGDKSETMRTA